jgi:hypothetical protein
MTQQQIDDLKQQLINALETAREAVNKLKTAKNKTSLEFMSRELDDMVVEIKHINIIPEDINEQ